MLSSIIIFILTPALWLFLGHRFQIRVPMLLHPLSLPGTVCRVSVHQKEDQPRKVNFNPSQP